MRRLDEAKSGAEAREATLKAQLRFLKADAAAPAKKLEAAEARALELSECTSGEEDLYEEVRDLKRQAAELREARTRRRGG